MGRKGEGRIIKSFGLPISKSSMYDKIEEIAAREKKSASELIVDILEDYAKIHSEGNPQHTLTSFQDNSDFAGFPSIAIDINTKTNWLKANMNDKKLTKELYYHVQEWKTRFEKYGFTF